MAYVRPALADLASDSAQPSPGQPQPPIWPLTVGAHGGWREVRSSAADGSCGVHGYPCQHPGVDVAGPAGTPVVAPESGTVAMVGDGSAAPFVGYGPWFAIIQGDSGKYHFLGHLEPTAAPLAPVGASVTAGQVVGATSSANHTHWEVRSKLVPDFASGEDNFSNNSDPLGWLMTQSPWFTALLLGGGALLLYLLARRAH